MKSKNDISERLQRIFMILGIILLLFVGINISGSVEYIGMKDVYVASEADKEICQEFATGKPKPFDFQEAEAIYNKRIITKEEKQAFEKIRLAVLKIPEDRRNELLSLMKYLEKTGKIDEGVDDEENCERFLASTLKHNIEKRFVILPKGYPHRYDDKNLLGWLE